MNDSLGSLARPISRALLLLLAFSACTKPLRLTATQSSLHPEKLAEMDAAINQAIADKKCPGGVLWFEHRGVSYHKAYGNRALVPHVEPMTEDTIFDAASLTKVIACTPAIMLLIERGKVKLDEPVHSYIPEFKRDGKEAITVHQLMTHTSGLRPDIETKTDWHGQQTAIQKACEEKLQTPPGTVFRYSDINYFLLGEIAQRAGGKRLEEFVATEIYRPLKMADSGYLPPKSKLSRIAPTEVVKGQPYRGIVHDPTARHMGGVAGHAGLFITAADLARFARMLLNDGTLYGTRIFKPETIRLMTSVQTPPSVLVRRGLGWDIDSGYSGPRGKIITLGSYGHTGWTGTSIWIDPFSQTFLIFLSNRNHPDENGNVGLLRARLGTLAGEAISDFNFAYVPGALEPRGEREVGRAALSAPRRTATSSTKTLNGIDVLVKKNFAPLKGLRVALITNHTGHDRERNPTIDLLKNSPEVQLKALFSPEHGIRGLKDESVSDSVDEKTGLPIYSLYPKLPERKPDQSEAEYAAMALELHKPKADQLKDLDALVFDIQDIGCRFYTYTSTLGLALKAAGEAGIKIFVLDRVDPIDAVTIDGPVLTSPSNFVHYHTVPVRYAMTAGELAQMINSERQFKADLTVIPVENWTRANWFDETGLPWTNPSPNMRSLNEAALYPGVGLLETTKVSVGRGTDTPFEIVGAPYIDDLKLADEMNRAALPGVRFVPVRFTPSSSMFKGTNCSGVNIVLTDREKCNVVDIGLSIAQTLHRLYPDNYNIERFNRLLGHSATIEAIKAGKTLKEIRAAWQPDLDEFQRRRSKFLIY
jgi:uncharacterized protein YbbC (DUF1343 family)/CubicO group peptidase (beta-lactamase class C family)